MHPVVGALGRAWQLANRFPSATLVLLGSALSVPYLVAGPGNFVDDWFALRNAVTGEWWEAAGSGQWRARPGAGVVYALIFGLVGARPLIHALLAAALVVATAVLLARVLRRFVDPGVALAVAALWLVVPNHTSLEVWPSALNIALSLLLLVWGVERLTVAAPRWRHELAAAALLGTSVACYEATAPAAAAFVVVVAWRRRGDRSASLRTLLLHGSVLAVIGAWMLLNWNEAKSGLDVWIDPVQVLNAHVSTSVVGEHPGAALLGALVVVVTVVAVYLHVRRPMQGSDRAVQLLLGGWAVVAFGTLPFLRYFYSPVGLGDRVTVVSGLGGSAVLVGVIGWLGRRNLALGSLLAIAVVVGAVGHRASLTADYATAADDSRRILAEVERRWPSPPDEPLVFGPHPVVKRNIVAFIDADWPVQWLYGSRSVSAGFTLTEDAFARYPDERRVDVVELSELEPTDRLDP